LAFSALLYGTLITNKRILRNALLPEI